MIPILFSLFVKIECVSGLSLLFALFDSVCSWRHNRASVFTEAQYAEAKAIAIDYISRFFPNNQLNPVFVPLHPNVANRLMELEQDVKAKRELAPAPPPAAAAAAVPALTLLLRLTHLVSIWTLTQELRRRMTKKKSSTMYNGS